MLDTCSLRHTHTQRRTTHPRTMCLCECARLRVCFSCTCASKRWWKLLCDLTWAKLPCFFFQDAQRKTQGLTHAHAHAWGKQKPLCMSTCSRQVTSPRQPVNTADAHQSPSTNITSHLYRDERPPPHPTHTHSGEAFAHKGRKVEIRVEANNLLIDNSSTIKWLSHYLDLLIIDHV